MVDPLVNKKIEMADDGQETQTAFQPAVKNIAPEVPKKSGKSTTPSGSDDQDNAEESSADDN